MLDGPVSPARSEGGPQPLEWPGNGILMREPRRDGTGWKTRPRRLILGDPGASYWV